MDDDGYATQVFRRAGAVITITGIPAVRVCQHCQNAVLEWAVAQQVEDLAKSLIEWATSHAINRPMMTVVFPAGKVAA